MSSCEIIEGITLHHGDCRDIMREMPAGYFDAIITDPPYGIAFKGENGIQRRRAGSNRGASHGRFRCGIDAPLDILI
jgi:DNA modification methylase